VVFISFYGENCRKWGIFGIKMGQKHSKKVAKMGHF
jgi:hypothetical protein